MVSDYSWKLLFVKHILKLIKHGAYLIGLKNLWQILFYILFMFYIILYVFSIYSVLIYYRVLNLSDV